MSPNEMQAPEIVPSILDDHTQPSLEVPGGGRWIEEGLFFQGDRPPVGAGDPRDWIEIPHENYIPISKSRLFRALWSFPLAEQHGLAFQHFLELLEGIYHFHYHKTLNELKEDYEFFSPEKGEMLREGIEESELIWRERRFLFNFIKAMTRGNFAPYTNDQYLRAIDQNYLFDLSVVINWEVYDERLIRGFLDEIDSDEGLAQREELELDGTLREFLQLPERFDERMLIFYRGIDRDQTQGLFIMQKIDVLLEKLLGFVIRRLQTVVEKLRGDEIVFDHGDGDTGEKRTTIFERRWLRRVNIGNQQPGIKDLFKPIKLQEPALERVIAVFRMKPPQPPKFIDQFPRLKPWFEKIFGKTKVEDRDWTLNIKMFKHIPLADSEIIFPEKSVRMKSFDLAMLVLTGLIGLGALVASIGKSKGVLAAIIGVLFAYAIKIILGYRRARANYMARMTKELYHKSLDNDVGVLQYLVDSLEDQEVKEAVLAYFFLLNAGRPLSEDELDGEVEKFLHEKFDGIEIDFEVDDALDKVIEKEGEQPHKHIPIVRTIIGPDGQHLYEAKPLEEALRIMDEKWDNFYEYNV